MPTATKETPKTESSTPAKPFVMPQPKRGQMVAFYPNGQLTAGNRTMAFVTRITRSNCELLAFGRVYEGVRHRDDPQLKTNVHARQFGAWDFTERDRQLDDLVGQLAQLCERVEKLETLLK